MSTRPPYALYIVFVGLPVVGVFFTIAGQIIPVNRLQSFPERTNAEPGFTLLTFVMEIIVVLGAARAAGSVFYRTGQPPVVGEMLAGIALGPSVFGAIAPRVSAALFPPAGLGYLNSLSQLGLVIFMFLVGLHLNLGELRNRGSAALLISHVSIAMPVFLGVVFARVVYGRLSSPDVPFAAFALFMGVGMAITAFPVLARILAHREMLRSPIGVLATAAAAVDDVTGWSLLAVIVVMVRGASSTRPMWITVLGPLAFVAAMVMLVRPALSRIFPPDRPLSDSVIASGVLFALVAAGLTEYLGIHLLFGGFLAGAIIPRRPELIDYMTQRLESVTNVLLLPLFFAYTGLRTRIGLVQGREMWTITAIVIATAIVGKFGGSMIAARGSGIPWRESVALGALMNTRGLMELVALNIGLDVGVVSPSLYSIMVVMALFTTILTGPLLSLLYPRHAGVSVNGDVYNARPLN